MNFKPYADKIVVRPIIEDTTKTGIFLPKTGHTHLIRAKVVAVSDGFMSASGQFCKLDSELGDIVIFQQGQGIPINLDGEEYLILQEVVVFGKEDTNPKVKQTEIIEPEESLGEKLSKIGQPVRWDNKPDESLKIKL